MNLDFPILYHQTKNKILCWKLFSFSTYYFTEYYYHPDGKKQVSNKIEDENHKKAKTLFNKKIRQGYTVNMYQTTEYFRPMLAHKYVDKGMKYLKEPFLISPKLDGIRCIAFLKNGEVFLQSRNGKEISFLYNIKYNLKCFFSRPKNYDLVLDGELYCHNLSFNQLSGIIRSTKQRSEMEDLIEFWIFDVVSQSPYLDRMGMLKEITGSSNIKIVPYQIGHHTDMKKAHDSYIEQGFEGLIARDLHQPYEVGVRSNYILKYKEFYDEEFEIVDTTTSVDDAIIFICKTNKNKIFNVRPRGSKDKFDKTKCYAGKLLTVRFQEKDAITEIPRFPVGYEIRDYE